MYLNDAWIGKSWRRTACPPNSQLTTTKASSVVIMLILSICIANQGLVPMLFWPMHRLFIAIYYAFADGQKLYIQNPKYIRQALSSINEIYIYEYKFHCKKTKAAESDPLSYYFHSAY